MPLQTVYPLDHQLAIEESQTLTVLQLSYPPFIPSLEQ